MDFSLSEQDQMVIEMVEAYTTRWLTDFRRREAEGAVPKTVRRAFEEAGLSLLAAEGEDFAEISGPARCVVLGRLAAADAGATLALWMSAAGPVLAQRLGVTAAQSEGLRSIQVVDAVDEVTHLPFVLADGSDRVLLLDGTGAWAVAQLVAHETHALALHGAGPVRGTVETRLANGTAPDAAREVVTQLRMVAAAMLVGLAKGAQAYAAEYMQTRKTFGKTLNQHQGLAFVFAEMAMATDGALLLLQKAAWTQGASRDQALADAYLQAVESALFTTSYGVQLLGGHGFMNDHPVEKWMREARALSLLWGGVDGARRDAARGED
jgi:alkylation response protein AidB-like acyl-CoA dehydrogenase